MYLMGDLNIIWMLQDCPLKSYCKFLMLLMHVLFLFLKQVIHQPTGICINSSGKRISTCIFTNAVQTLVLTHLDYCSVVKCIKKTQLQFDQNRPAGVALNCNRRANSIRIHKTWSWSLVRDRTAICLLCFVQNISLSKIVNVLYHQLPYSNGHSCRHARGFFFHFLSQKLMQGNTLLCTEGWKYPHHYHQELHI